MKERPILFSGPMVRAIMEGRKTQTRRVMKPQPVNEKLVPLAVNCPYGHPGDRLWIRETWTPSIDKYGTLYRAGPNDVDLSHKRWRPSIHMPRWRSRITLAVKGVRVERLQDISHPDASAEGVDYVTAGQFTAATEGFVHGFRLLWNSINAKRGFGWDVDPWVWVVEFERASAT